MPRPGGHVGEAYDWKQPTTGALAINARIIDSDEHLARNAWGDEVVNITTPVIQTDASMGLQSGSWLFYTRQDGLLGTSGSVFELHSGTGSYSAAILETRERIRYRAGQGILMRWTSLYDEPTEGIRSFSGPSSQTSAIQFGYSGSQFGIVHQPHSVAHIFRFDVTSPSTTNETGYFYFGNLEGPNTASFVLTNNGTGPETANEIAKGDFSSIHHHGYNVQSSGSSVIFVHRDPESHLGEETIVINASTMSGTFVEITPGDLRNDFFIPQSQWSIDKMDGTGPSGMILDPQKGNVYQVAFQYLGYGNTVFSIENDETGKMTPVHVLKWVNRNIDPVLQTTSFPIQWIIEHTGSGDTSTKFLRGASGAGFIQGSLDGGTKRRFAYSRIVTNVSTSFLNLMHFKPSLVFNDRANLGTIRPIELVVSSTDELILVRLRKNVVVGNSAVWFTPEKESAALIDISSGNGTGGQIFSGLTVGANDSIAFDLNKYRISLNGIPSQDTISIQARTATGTSIVVFTMVWEEDI